MWKFLAGLVFGFLAGIWLTQFILGGGLAMLGGHP